MKNFSTILLALFIGMFWVFRIVVAIGTEFGIDMGGIKVLNMNIEVILLFVVLLALILIVKRKMIGAIIYLVAYGMYFGVDLFNSVVEIANGDNSVNLAFNAFISLIGIVIPIAVFFDMLLDKQRKANPKDKKTDWFYKNEQYDRKLDERADKNNYRTGL